MNSLIMRIILFFFYKMQSYDLDEWLDFHIADISILVVDDTKPFFITVSF